MKIQFKPALIAALTAAGFAATAAHAEGLTANGPYAGASIGTPSYQDDVNGFGGNGDDASAKLYGGYQFTPNFAVEGGYAALGKTRQPNGEVRSQALFADAVGIVPITGNFSLLGRLGAAEVKADTPNGDDHGFGVHGGAGVQYAFTQNVAVRGEWERYHVDLFGDKPDIDQYTVGLRVGF
jgi:OmpA-OmpF porin, OOP family